MDDNTLYTSDRQKYMIKAEKIDIYDHDMMTSSLDNIRDRSDNPTWFNENNCKFNYPQNWSRYSHSYKH